MPEHVRGEKKGLFSGFMKRQGEKSQLAQAFSEGDTEKVRQICDSAEQMSVINAIDEAARRGWWGFIDYAAINYDGWVARHAVDVEAAARHWHALLDLSEKRRVVAMGLNGYILKQFERANTAEVKEAIANQDWRLVNAFASHAKGEAAAQAKKAADCNMHFMIRHLTEDAFARLGQKLAGQEIEK